MQLGATPSWTIWATPSQLGTTSNPMREKHLHTLEDKCIQNDNSTPNNLHEGLICDFQLVTLFPLMFRIRQLYEITCLKGKLNRWQMLRFIGKCETRRECVQTAHRELTMRPLCPLMQKAHYVSVKKNLRFK